MGGFPKILRNFQSGSWQMLTSNYKVGGWGKKGQKHAYVIFEWSLTARLYKIGTFLHPWNCRGDSTPRILALGYDQSCYKICINVIIASPK